MIITAIEVKVNPGEYSKQGLQGDAEVSVTMRYTGTRLEASMLAALLKPGSQTPPQEFWDALDWGEVKPLANPAVTLHILPIMPNGQDGQKQIVAIRPGTSIEVPMYWMQTGDDMPRIISGTVQIGVV